MKNNYKKYVLVLAIIVIVIIIVLLSKKNGGEGTGVIINEVTGVNLNDKASEIVLKNFNNNIVRLSDYKGKIVIVNAWAGWCPFCINEMPDLQEASDKNDDLIVLFVHRTRTENIDTAKKFLENFKSQGKEIKDPVLTDPDDIFYKTFFGFGMPVTLFVDKEGVIKDKKVGPLTQKEIEEKIEKII